MQDGAFLEIAYLQFGSLMSKFMLISSIYIMNFTIFYKAVFTLKYIQTNFKYIQCVTKICTVNLT